jgi:hypothetical protein
MLVGHEGRSDRRESGVSSRNWKRMLPFRVRPPLVDRGRIGRCILVSSLYVSFGEQKMTTRDGREVARHNDLRVLKALHKLGWLRTRDLAALIWMNCPRPKTGGFQPVRVEVSAAARRMAQRTLRRLRLNRKVLWIKAPDGSQIYGLSELGARQLVGLCIPAKSGNDEIRRVSLSYFHHRRLANEVAISALLQGYRVNGEREISAGEWLGGKDGVMGKMPDVLVRDGKNVWFCEIERSNRRNSDYTKLLHFLKAMWPVGKKADEPAELPGGHLLQQVVFVSNAAFIRRVHGDLETAGWSEMMIAKRIFPVCSLYISEEKFITFEVGVHAAEPLDN